MNFLIRTITAAVYAFVLLFCMQKGGAWFIGLFGLCTILATFEFTGLANAYKKADVSRLCSTALATAAYFWVALIPLQKGVTVSQTLFLAFFLITFICELYLQKESPIRTIAFTLLPVVYIALPYSLLSSVAYSSGTYQCAIPVAIFIMLWCNDAGAYCTGCTIGRHKLFERISPKKTWEGSIGGAVLTVIGTVVLTRCLPDIYGYLPLWTWIGMALTVVVFGTWGDLFESMIKREMGIKDSGKILPGHGGMLDRFDSALIAIPAATVYLNLISLFL